MPLKCLIHCTDDIDTIHGFNNNTGTTTVSYDKQWQQLGGVKKNIANSFDPESAEPPADAW